MFLTWGGATGLTSRFTALLGSLIPSLDLHTKVTSQLPRPPSCSQTADHRRLGPSPSPPVSRSSPSEASSVLVSRGIHLSHPGVRSQGHGTFPERPASTCQERPHGRGTLPASSTSPLGQRALLNLGLEEKVSHLQHPSPIPLVPQHRQPRAGVGPRRSGESDPRILPPRDPGEELQGWS